MQYSLFWIRICLYFEDKMSTSANNQCKRRALDAAN